MTILEIEAIEHLDFDAEVPCDHCPEKAAVWKMTRSCCDAVFFQCDPCKEGCVAFIQRNQSIDGTLVCHMCNTLKLPAREIAFERLS